MIAASIWSLDPLKILTRRELAAVLAGPAPRSAGARMNRVIFRLACCCGLRVSEIAALRLADVCVEGARPHLRVRPEGAKGHKARRVPLWWDAGTLADLAAWKEERRRQRAAPHDPFICCLKPGGFGQPLRRHSLRRRFLTACKALGLERLRTLTIHHGRHTFVSHALAGGRSLAEVKSAAGHASLLTTSAYLHVAVDDEGQPGSLFRYA
ncbi:MAG: site-specific integrase [Planctomycetes bacterium]|nr:site-specific integrase [Planctomycetota bacterium]